jgi:hypothetical protein
MTKRHDRIIAVVLALGSGSGTGLIAAKAQAQSFNDSRQVLVPPGDAMLSNPGMACRPEHPHVQDLAARHPLITGIIHHFEDKHNLGRQGSWSYCIPKSALAQHAAGQGPK